MDSTASKQAFVDSPSPHLPRSKCTGNRIAMCGTCWTGIDHALSGGGRGAPGSDGPAVSVLQDTFPAVYESSIDCSRNRGGSRQGPRRAQKFFRTFCGYDLSVYVALTNIPVGELLTGFAMRSDPNFLVNCDLNSYLARPQWSMDGQFARSPSAAVSPSQSHLTLPLTAAAAAAAAGGGGQAP